MRESVDDPSGAFGDAPDLLRENVDDNLVVDHPAFFQAAVRFPAKTRSKRRFWFVAVGVVAVISGGVISAASVSSRFIFVFGVQIIAGPTGKREMDRSISPINSLSMQMAK